MDYNFDGVTAYTAEAGPASLTKIVEAVPVKEFIPIIESRMAQRSTDALSTEVGADLLNTIEIANSEVSTRAASSSNWDGYAVYRDGVTSAGIEINWHAGIVVSSSGNYTTIEDIAHHSGEGATSLASYSEFLDGNSFMGGYRKTTNTSTRNKIVATSNEMVEEAISYTVFSLITHNASSSDK